MHIDPAYVESTLQQLVRINSINPAFSDGTTNERAIAEWLATELASLGLSVALRAAAPDRMSVVGRRRGIGGGPSLMLYGHIDTVGVEGMLDPFSGASPDGRIHGRGAYDMKCGVAACLGALHALRQSDTVLSGDVIFAGVADEEVASIGMQDVLTAYQPDAAIVTEPTELRVCIAHKGFTWLELETTGVAAHGSRFVDGRDANLMMASILARLSELERELLQRKPHHLVGPPSLHVGTVHGGTGISTYAARCIAEIERRTVPGETEAQVVAEITEVINAAIALDPRIKASLRTTLHREAFEARTDSAIGRVVIDAATAVTGTQPPVIGETYWMDAAFLGAAGVDTVVIGPSGTGAHAIEEWVDVQSVIETADILARACATYCISPP